MEKRFNINVDLKRKSSQIISGLKQGDNNDVLYIKLLQDSLAYDITNLSVRANFKRPDGAEYFQGAGAGVEIINAVQGDIKITVLSEVLDIIGELQADISIFENQNKISSGTFKMLIESSVFSTDALQNRQGGDLIQNLIVTEEKRVEAEDDRKLSEVDRKTSEDDRKLSEVDRKAAEDDRKLSEVDRKTAEVDRKASEEDRNAAEIDRETKFNEAIFQEVFDGGQVAIENTEEITSKINAINSQLAEKVNGIDVTTNAQTDGVNTTFGHKSNAIASDISTSVIAGGGCTGYNNIIGGDGSATVNTDTPNTTTPGTGAHVSFVAGYDNVAGSLSSKIISDHSYTEVGGQGHNAIYGGSQNVIRSTANHSGIFSGKQCDVSGNNSVAMGLLNVVTGKSAIATGDHQTVSGDGGLAFGTTNTVSGLYARAEGSTNTASGNFGSAVGNYAYSRSVAQHAFTGGRFAALGDAQTSVIEMHRETADATTVNLGRLNGNTSHQLLANQSVTFSILVIARDKSGTDSAGWEIKGVAYRGATGSSILVGTPIITSLGASAGAAAWTVGMSGDTSGGLNVRITGEAGKTIRWVQRMTLSEVLAA